jgi:hypothetical protein
LEPTHLSILYYHTTTVYTDCIWSPLTEYHALASTVCVSLGLRRREPSEYIPLEDINRTIEGQQWEDDGVGEDDGL